MQAYFESLKSTKIAQKFWNSTDATDTLSGATIFAPIDKVRFSGTRSGTVNGLL
jgi:hypothetical protein